MAEVTAWQARPVEPLYPVTFFDALRVKMAAALKPVYTAPSAELVAAELDAFEQGAWGHKFPTASAAWRRAWDRVIPFFAFPSQVRRVTCTSNAIESIHSPL